MREWTPSPTVSNFIATHLGDLTTGETTPGDRYVDDVVLYQ